MHVRFAKLIYKSNIYQYLGFVAIIILGAMNQFGMGAYLLSEKRPVTHEFLGL